MLGFHQEAPHPAKIPLCFTASLLRVGLGVVSLRSLIEMMPVVLGKKDALGETPFPGFTRFVMGHAFPGRMSLFIAFSLSRSRKVSALASERAE